MNDQSIITKDMLNAAKDSISAMTIDMHRKALLEQSLRSQLSSSLTDGLLYPPKRKEEPRMRKSVHCNVIRKPAQHVAAPTDYLALDVKLRAALDEFSILERLAKNIKDAVKASRDEYGDHQLERGDMVTISGSSPDTSLGFQIEMSADGSQIDVAVFDTSTQKSDTSTQKETAGPLDDYDLAEL